MVRKKTLGDWHPCGDYQALNHIIIPDRYLIPHIQDFSVTLHGATIFPNWTWSAYIIKSSEDVPKTAITTTFDLFEFLRMPFGLKNAAQTFQCFIDQVLSGLHFSYAYIDDILVASSTPKEHIQHLQLVLERFKHYDMIIRPSKCVMGVTTLQFLGHQIDNEGIRPLEETVTPILDFPLPATHTKL